LEIFSAHLCVPLHLGGKTGEKPITAESHSNAEIRRVEIRATHKNSMISDRNLAVLEFRKPRFVV
jgi:hypothetical protein